MALANELEVPKRKRSSKLGNIVSGGILLGTLSVAALVLIGNHRIKKEKDELYNKISLTANTNKDNITNAKEWADVYGSLGLTYDMHYSNPKKDLSLEQMREYLGKE